MFVQKWWGVNWWDANDPWSSGPQILLWIAVELHCVLQWINHMAVFRDMYYWSPVETLFLEMSSKPVRGRMRPQAFTTGEQWHLPATRDKTTTQALCCQLCSGEQSDWAYLFTCEEFAFICEREKKHLSRLVCNLSVESARCQDGLCHIWIHSSSAHSTLCLYCSLRINHQSRCTSTEAPIRSISLSWCQLWLWGLVLWQSNASLNRIEWILILLACI